MHMDSCMYINNINLDIYIVYINIFFYNICTYGNTVYGVVYINYSNIYAKFGKLLNYKPVYSVVQLPGQTVTSQAALCRSSINKCISILK